MKTGVLFTGGKDSCLALNKVMNEKYEVKCLLNIDVENKDSFMFHKADQELLKMQAQLLNLPLITRKSEGKKEKELKDLKRLLEMAGDIDAVVVGGIKSSYQGKRVKKICKELGLKFIAPLWDYNPEKLWEELFKEKFKVILTKISCEGLSSEWLNRVIDKKNFKELKKAAKKYGFRLDFEGGEAESLVLWMPGMEKEIEVKGKKKSEGKYRHFFKIKKIKLIK